MGGVIYALPYFDKGEDMADSKLRVCCVDRAKYKYCNHCKDYNPIETWRFAFCSENCRDIYNITSSFEDGRVTANEAKAQLDKLDLFKLDSFGESYKSTIAKITDENAVIENPLDEEIVNPIVEESIEQIQETIEVTDETVNDTESDKVEDTIEEKENEVRNYRKSKKRTIADVED
jgi:tyrosyl-tRNA synthetase